jgi:hypothetical protein
MELEGPDEPIPLHRASEISGLAQGSLRDAARSGRLKAIRLGHDWLTTRRKGHHYLSARSRGPVKALPADYQTPEGEEPAPRR